MVVAVIMGVMYAGDLLKSQQVDAGTGFEPVLRGPKPRVLPLNYPALNWRRGPGSNRLMIVLQTIAVPLRHHAFVGPVWRDRTSVPASTTRCSAIELKREWCCHEGSNLAPTAYKAVALPAMSYDSF